MSDFDQWVEKERKDAAVMQQMQHDFFQAIRDGDTETMTRIVHTAPDCDDALDYWKDKRGRTSLFAALAADKIESFRCLLEMGANIGTYITVGRKLDLSRIFKGSIFTENEKTLPDMIAKDQKKDFLFAICQIKGYVHHTKILGKPQYRELLNLAVSAPRIHKEYIAEKNKKAMEDQSKPAALPAAVKPDFEKAQVSAPRTETTPIATTYTPKKLNF